MRVLIAGGGIGGLTTAIALRHQGIDALVLEQAQVMDEIGAGIQIASNAAIVLRELGLESAIRAVGVKPQSYDYRDLRTGRMLYQAPLGDEAAGRYGAPMYNVHRADLIQILFDAVPSEARRLGARVAAVSQDEDGVEVRLQTGEILRGDALVGCDGIHSAVRKHLRGNEEKHFANILMWRSLIPAERLEGLGLEERGNYWFGPGRTLITYWVRPKNLYSILASVPAHEVQRESWTESGDISEMLPSFEDAEPRARTMLEQCRERLHHRHVLPRPDRQLDLGPRHAARRRRASDGAVSRRRRRPEHRGCLDVCARAGAPAARCLGRAAGISATPSAAHHADPGRCARRRQADARAGTATAA